MLTGRSLIAVLMLAAGHLTAQRPSVPDSSAATIIAQGRREARFFNAIPVLRQVRTARNGARRDELADSLAQIASADPGHGADREANRALSRMAISALGEAANRLEEGPPYEGALDRLIRIQQQQPDYGVRLSALDVMLAAGDHARALNYLVTVASSTDSTAGHAMFLLTVDADPKEEPVTSTPAEKAETAAALRRLWEACIKEDPLPPNSMGQRARPSTPAVAAWGALASFATRQGWM